MTTAIRNRPTFREPIRPGLATRDEVKASSKVYRTLSEDVLDRLRLIGAAERYEGRDWRGFREA